jgi:hypothetical protein
MHPVSIDPQISRDAWDARTNAERAASIRRTLDFYAGRPDLEPFTPIAELESDLRQRSRWEGECLRLIGRQLREAGFNVGQQVEIDGHLYRVTNPGCPAVHLGQIPPVDEPEEIEADDEKPDDEVGQWAYEYANATRPEV